MKRINVDINDNEYLILKGLAKESNISVAKILGEYAKELTKKGDTKLFDKDWVIRNQETEKNMAIKEGLQPESLAEHNNIAKETENDTPKSIIEPSDGLEKLTILNLLNQSIIDVKNFLDQEIDKKENSKLTKDDLQELLSQHLDNIGKIVEGYNNQKKEGVLWKDRITHFKKNLKSAYNNFKESFKQKVQAIKEAPINLKNYTKNKLIDGFVAINDKIINKANEITQKMEEKRPNNLSTGKQKTTSNSPKEGQPLIADYKEEYKKHLFNNFIGNQQYEVNKVLINHLDSQLTNKPFLSLQLRQEAIAELHQEFLNANDKNSNIDVGKFNAYLEDKSELFAHGLRHFDDFQQKELLSEDLKFNVYQEPEKK